MINLYLYRSANKQISRVSLHHLCPTNRQRKKQGVGKTAASNYHRIPGTGSPANSSSARIRARARVRVSKGGRETRSRFWWKCLCARGRVASKEFHRYAYRIDSSLRVVTTERNALFFFFFYLFIYLFIFR